jgi:type II secretory pathway pseudopilin PulG
MNKRSENSNRRRRAFTLLEVMIATAIFFAAVFSILALVGQCLRSARGLHKNAPTAGMVAAEQISMTNKVEEGIQSGDFGDLYPDWEWETSTVFFASNGMYQVDIAVLHKGNLDSSISILAYKPDSTTGLSTQSKFRR